MLLTARLEAAGTAWDVRLRNISETGALVEGSGLPAAGTAVRLRRSRFEIGANVAWSSGTRCGVSFEAAVDVRSLVDGSGGMPAPAHQRRADAIQAAVRSGAFAGAAGNRIPDLATDELDARIAEELGYVQRLLQSLGDSLVADRGLVHRHASALQHLDLAGQLLGQLADVITAEDRNAAVAAIGKADLRARLSRRTRAL